MPDACVVFGCSNTADPKKGIGVHKIPFWGDSRPECIRRRKKWVDFVLQRRAHWEPTKTSKICSQHFRREDFSRMFSLLPGQKNPSSPRLKADELGPCVFPSIQSNSPEFDGSSPPQSTRTRRSIARKIVKEMQMPTSTSTTTSTGELAKNSAKGDGVEPEEHVELDECSPECAVVAALQTEQAVINPGEVMQVETATEELNPGISAVIDHSDSVDERENCSNCGRLQNELRILRNQVKSLQDKLSDHRKEKKTIKRRLTSSLQHLTQEDDVTVDAENKEVNGDSDEYDCDVNDECEGADDGKYDTETETDETIETETEEEEEDCDDKPDRLTTAGKSLRSEPKHIVFLSQLLLLFNFCHVCKTDNPSVEARQVGTKAVVTSTCHNPKCPKQENTWHSQPNMPNSRIAAGNFLLCLSILLAGGSATKVFQIFSHMGLGCVSLNTFFKCQRSKLFPTIYIYWQTYQAKLLEKVKAIQGGVVVAGDGRHDSMGHSAKFGAYTIFCCTLPMIIHFALIQRNQAGSSPAMEFMGFKQCMEYLLGCGVLITTLISDRHTTIASHMRKVLTNIVHYFDIWHLKKKIRKVLSKLSKEKGLEVLADWIKPCENHLYWSATTTFSGNGKVIWAKFKTFMSHIIDKHSSLADPLFNKCGHGEIHPRKWLHAGSVAYEKLCAALTNNSLVKGIKQASPFAQTSCLEGFHSLLNQFAPKMIAYSYVGMYCRHILAAVHFNFNLHRDAKCKESDGTERVRISYPKFKNGEATVRNVKITPNFEYVEEIFQVHLNSSKDELEEAARKLRNMTPAPMNTMLEKQPREEAIEKRVKRAKMVVIDVPPTTTPVPDQPVASTTSNTRKRKKQKQKTPTNDPKKARYCSVCKNPMKGHQKLKDCPKNKK